MVKGEMEIYIAGPFGFSEAGRDFYYGKIIPLVKSLGYGALDPWKLTDDAKIQEVISLSAGRERILNWQRLNLEIADNNFQAIRRCKGILAILDGTDVDSGTACEIGFGYALGKPILGYRGDFRLSADNEGGIVNLQVEGAIRRSGGSIISTLDQLAAEAIKVFGKPE